MEQIAAQSHYIIVFDFNFNRNDFKKNNFDRIDFNRNKYNRNDFDQNRISDLVSPNIESIGFHNFTLNRL